MRAITIRQPWALAVACGAKTVENRSRNIAGSYRGPVLIHAGAQVDEAAFDNSTMFWWLAEQPRQHVPFATGVVLGVVDLVGVHTAAACPPPTAWCSPWALPLHHHLQFANARQFAEPIPAKGKLGLWTPDADLLAAVREQMAETVGA